MGLDGIEIVMEVEETFGITIPLSQASQMRTVADLVDLCFQRVKATENQSHPSKTSFFALRALVRDAYSDSDLRIRPSDPVESVIHVSQRKRFWKILAKEFDFEPDALRRPVWMRWTLTLFVLLFFAWMCLALPLLVEVIPLLLFGTGCFALVLHWLTKPFRTVVPNGYQTIGDIAHHIARLTYATKPPEIRDYDHVAKMVIQIVADMTDVKTRDIGLKTRFYDDLGVG